MIQRALVIAVAFLVLPLSAGPALPTVSSTFDTGCVGCQGSGGGAATSAGGSCGGTVTISVLMAPGECRFAQSSDEPDGFDCRSTRGCLPTVSRSWAGLEANSGLDFCVTLYGQTMCLQPKPSAGSGSGSSALPSAHQSCSDSQVRTFSIESDSCGLFASTQTRCSSCDGL